VHGISAQGFSTAPRLAGQRDEYTENQLLGFKEHIRDNPYSKQYMWGARKFSPRRRMICSLLFDAPPEAANDGDRELLAAEERYMKWGSRIQYCVCLVCHGRMLRVREFSLGGLSYSYLKRRLEQWGEGFHAAAEPMPRIASTLSPTKLRLSLHI